MSLTYATYVTAIAAIVDVAGADIVLASLIPQIIDDAEQRLYRELDLLATVVRDSSGVLVIGTRVFTFPQHFVVCEEVSIADPVTSAQTQLVPTTREYINGCYGAGTTAAAPIYYGMITDQQILLGPPPDLAYPVTVTGTIRPTPLSVSNPTTYLSTYLPDLFLAESMRFAYMRGLLQQDPQKSEQWNAHYAELFQSANTEETRKRYASSAWTAKQPTPLSTPPRA